MWLFLAFLAVPLIEIALFIQVGGVIGLFPTLGIVIVTAVLGAVLVRAQGGQVMAQLRGSLENMRDPTEPLAHGAMILFAGALLLTPGFFTDTVGFILLTPPGRRWIFAKIRARVHVQSFGPGQQGQRPHPQGSDIIDGDFEVVGDKDDAPTSQKPSGWTQH